MEHTKKRKPVRLTRIVLTTALICSLVIFSSCSTNDERDVVYENQAYGFSITIPESFSDATEIREDGNCVYFVNKSIQETALEHVFGVVGRIEVYSKDQFSREDIDGLGDIYSLRYLGENDICYFGWAQATDVQTPEDATEDVLDKHRRLEQEFRNIIKSFTISEKIAFETINHEEYMVLGLVKNYDISAGIITFDQVEWIDISDVERIAQLGLDPDQDFLNGYYVYNEEIDLQVLKVTDETRINIIDWINDANLMETDEEGLESRISEYDTLFHLRYINDTVIEMAEQYRP